MRGNILILVQIGSNIGLPSDVLYKSITKGDCSCVLVEPDPVCFEKLKENYAKVPNVYFINCAISSYCGKIKLYREKKANYSQWISVNKSHLMGHKLKEEDLDEFEVNCITLENLFQRMDLTNIPIDCLQIDTEGHDSVIILSTDFSKLKIKTIVFEYVHMDGVSTAGPTLNKVFKHLFSFGYNLIAMGSTDMVFERNL